MKISSMQKIDFYAGVPLTFACGLYLKTKHFFKPQEKKIPSQVRHILCIELSEMGSMVQLAPLIAKMQATYPQAAITFATFRSSAPILHILGMIDKERILTLRTNNLFLFTLDLMRMILAFTRTDFDMVFDFELFSRISSLLSFFSGAPVKVGFDNFQAEGLYRGKFLTHPVTYNHHQHIAKNFFGMWYALGENWGDLPHTKRVIPDEEIRLPAIALAQKPQEVEALRAKLHAAFPSLKDAKKLVLLNPNSSEALPLRRWPMQYYLELTRRLSDHADVHIAVTGGPDEREDARVICTALQHARVVDLSGFTSMGELISLYRIADLMITNDSGPAQFAALAQMKTIGLFGPETPALYGPLNPNGYNFFKNLHCSPCYAAQNHRRSLCTNNLCMQLITVDEVYSKAKEMLALAA